MTLRRKLHLVLLALLATAGAVEGAPAGAPTGPAKPEVVAPMKGSDLSKLIDEFQQRRDSMLADRQKLLEQLRTATVEQRKQILARMQAQQKDLLDAQRALGKQIRDEMRKMRETLPGPGHR